LLIIIKLPTNPLTFMFILAFCKFSKTVSHAFTIVSFIKITISPFESPFTVILSIFEFAYIYALLFRFILSVSMIESIQKISFEFIAIFKL